MNDKYLSNETNGNEIKIKIKSEDVKFDLKIDSSKSLHYLRVKLMYATELNYSRTCFSLSLNGNILDNEFSKLKDIENFKDGALIEIKEKPYSLTESYMHLDHLIKFKDLLYLYENREHNLFSYVKFIKQNNNISNYNEPHNCILPDTKNLLIDNRQALKQIIISRWNPPPVFRKLRGDLTYIYVFTIENKSYYITSSIKGFYVNKSTDNEFNPDPFNSLVYHSLFDLISFLSPVFKKKIQFAITLDSILFINEKTSPYESHLWSIPKLDHQINSISTKKISSDSLYDYKKEKEKIFNMERNEKLQTERELYRRSLDANYNFISANTEYVNAAVQNTIYIIDSNVLASKLRSSMIVFSDGRTFGFENEKPYKFAVYDGMIFYIIDDYKDPFRIQCFKSWFTSDIEGLSIPGFVTVNYRGYCVIVQTIIPGILELLNSKKCIYGSYDDGKTIFSNDKYLQSLDKTCEKLKISPHKVYDHNGKLIELKTPIHCYGLIGDDDRHYILNLAFFQQDVNYYQLPIEEYSKEVLDQGYPKKYKHDYCFLRQELIDTFYEYRYTQFKKYVALGLLIEKKLQEEFKDKEEEKKFLSLNELMEHCTMNDLNSNKTYKEIEQKLSLENEDDCLINTPKKIIKTAAKLVGSLKDDSFYLRFNPNAFSTLFKHDDTDKTKLVREKQLIKDAAEFILTHQIPSFISDCLKIIISPINGQALSKELHDRGINMRYLGKIAKELSKFKRLRYLYSITVEELICRSAKYEYSKYIQNVNLIDLTSSISLFLNYFLSACKDVDNNNIQLDNKLKPEIFLYKLKNNLQDHFSFELECQTMEEVVDEYGLNKISILRNFCLKTGTQLLLRDYRFDHKSLPTFNDDDILNLYPIVKNKELNFVPNSDLIRLKLRKIKEIGEKGEMEDIIIEELKSFCLPRSSLIFWSKIKCDDITEKVIEAFKNCTFIHRSTCPEIAEFFSKLARNFYNSSNYKYAIEMQEESVSISENLSGIDHPITIIKFIYLGLYCFAGNQISKSLQFFYRARYLLELNSGKNHPEMSVIDLNIGLIFYSIGDYNKSLKYFNNALNINEFYYDDNSLKIAMNYDLISMVQCCSNDFKNALKNQEKAYNIFKRQLGNNHEKSIESGKKIKFLEEQVSCQKLIEPTNNSILNILNIINKIVNLK